MWTILDSYVPVCVCVCVCVLYRSKMSSATVIVDSTLKYVSVTSSTVYHVDLYHILTIQHDKNDTKMFDLEMLI